jgi:hypothetical protein
MIRKLLFFVLLASFAGAQVNNARMLSGVSYQVGTTYTFVAADATRMVSFSNVLSIAATMPAPSTTGFGAGTLFTVKDTGAGTLTITCSGCTISSAATLVLNTGQSADIYSDGTNYVAAIAAPSPVSSVFGRTGAVAAQAGDYAVAQVTGAAPLASPALTGTPTAPTAAPGDNSTKIATTAFTAAAAASASAIQIQGITVSNSTLQVGDQLTYNTYGDSKWDITTSFTRLSAFYAEGNEGGSVPQLANVGAPASMSPTGTTSSDYATETDGMGITYTTAAAGTSYASAFYSSTAAGAGRFVRGQIARFTARMKLKQTANSRFWLGLIDNGATSLNTVATDTPNGKYCMFRFSVTTDTTWKAVCGTATANQTVVDTSVAVNTSASQLFEITFDGTNFNFYIDGVLKAQISSNIPTSGTTLNMVAQIDNKGSAAAVGYTFQTMAIVMR